MKILFFPFLFFISCGTNYVQKPDGHTRNILVFDSNLTNATFMLVVNGQPIEEIKITNLGPGIHHPEYIVNHKFSDNETVLLYMLKNSEIVAEGTAVFDAQYQSENYPESHGFYVEILDAKSLKLHPIGSILLD